MRSSKQRITRRSFLAAPAALAVSGTAMARPANAYEAALLDQIDNLDVAKAAILSARHCSRYGFCVSPWLPRPIEVDLLANDPILLRDVAMRAADIIARGAFDAKFFSKLTLVTLPKRTHGALRLWAIAEPQDTVAYLTLAVLAAPVIEAHRIPTSSEVAHSWRFSPGRYQLFDERYTLASFHAASRRRAGSTAFLVICDLVNCYGNLSADQVAAAVGQSGVPGWQAEYLRQLLGFWQTPESPGLPVASNASRILAEAVLLQIDNRLRGAGIEFVRYADDFRLFAEDESAARRTLEAVADAAAPHGLALNPDKTQIVRLGETTTEPDLQVIDNEKLCVASDSENLPHNFRRASVAEIRMLRSAHNKPNAQALLQSKAAPPVSALRRAMRQAIYAGHDDFLYAVPAILRRYPEAAGVYSFALRQASEFVSVGVRDHLRIELSAMLLDPMTPDFVTIKLIEILSNPAYRDREALERFARARAGAPRGMTFRAALDGLRETGGAMPDLAALFDEMDGWAKRALLADPAFRRSITYSPATPDLIAAKLAT